MIYIISLQYSPVFKSLCYAMGKQLKKHGYEIKYLFSSEYQWMLEDEDVNEIEFIGKSKNISSIFVDSINFLNLKLIKRLIDKDQPEKIYFHNIHPFFNYYIAKKVKNYGGTVIQHVHEPFVYDKSHYGKFQQYWLYLFEYVQGLILKKTDVAILSSQEAWDLFNKRYPDFEGKKIRIPLLYEDLAKDMVSLPRHYLNFIGPPVPAKNPEKFLEIVKNSQEKDLNFILISRRKIQDRKYYQYNNLKLFQKERISDNLIGKFMQNSIMTITPYKTARQSSVVATAFMYGTPVLATNINGLNEVVDHKITGYLVDKDAGVKEWLDGIVYIQNNIKDLSNSCRDFFKINYSEINWVKYFKEVFEIDS